MEAHQIALVLVWGGVGLSILLPTVYYWLPPGPRRLLETVAVAAVLTALTIGGLALALWIGLPVDFGSLLALGLGGSVLSSYCYARRGAPASLVAAGATQVPAILCGVYAIHVTESWIVVVAVMAIGLPVSWLLHRKLRPYELQPGR
jgi:hypothetical protein